MAHYQSVYLLIKCYVVVTGLPESDDEEETYELFTDICELHFSINQASYLTEVAYAWADLLMTNQEDFL